MNWPVSDNPDLSGPIRLVMRRAGPKIASEWATMRPGCAGSEQHPTLIVLLDQVGSAAMESVMGLYRSKAQPRSPSSMGEDPKPEGLSGR